MPRPAAEGGRLPLYPPGVLALLWLDEGDERLRRPANDEQPLAGRAGGDCAEVEDGDSVLGGDAVRHSGSAHHRAIGGPRNDRIDGPVEICAEQGGRVPRMELAHRR